MPHAIIPFYCCAWKWGVPAYDHFGDCFFLAHQNPYPTSKSEFPMRLSHYFYHDFHAHPPVLSFFPVRESHSHLEDHPTNRNWLGNIVIKYMNLIELISKHCINYITIVTITMTKPRYTDTYTVYHLKDCDQRQGRGRPRRARVCHGVPVGGACSAAARPRRESQGVEGFFFDGGNHQNWSFEWKKAATCGKIIKQKTCSWENHQWRF